MEAPYHYSKIFAAQFHICRSICIGLNCLKPQALLSIPKAIDCQVPGRRLAMPASCSSPNVCVRRQREGFRFPACRELPQLPKLGSPLWRGIASKTASFGSLGKLFCAPAMLGWTNARSVSLFSDRPFKGSALDLCVA